MHAFHVLFLKELRSFFFSSTAYVVIALFTFLNGWLFVGMVRAMQTHASPGSLIHNLLGSGWFWMGYLVLFPLITMRLFAEERKMGTIEGLFTAPVRTSEVLLAKYAASIVAYAAILLPLFLFFPAFYLITGETGAFHSGAVIGSAVGLFLVGVFHLSIGIFASSLTANALVAAMMTFAMVMLHYFLGFLQNFGIIPDSMWAEFINYFSTVRHMEFLTEGLIDSRPVFYYISFSVVLLACTHHILESRKWRS